MCNYNRHCCYCSHKIQIKQSFFLHNFPLFLILFNNFCNFFTACLAVFRQNYHKCLKLIFACKFNIARCNPLRHAKCAVLPGVTYGHNLIFRFAHPFSRWILFILSKIHIKVKCLIYDKNKSVKPNSLTLCGADYETRTRYLHLGKVTLYRVS